VVGLWFAREGEGGARVETFVMHTDHQSADAECFPPQRPPVHHPPPTHPVGRVLGVVIKSVFQVGQPGTEARLLSLWAEGEGAKSGEVLNLKYHPAGSPNSPTYRTLRSFW